MAESPEVAHSEGLSPARWLAGFSPGRRRRVPCPAYDDAQLVRHAARGDTEAFAAVYDRHAKAALTLAARVVGDHGVAQDVCQQAFLDIWRSAGSYDPARGTARAWVLGVVRNRAIDAVRLQAARDRRLPDDETAPARIPGTHRTERVVEHDEEVAELRAALDALPDEQRRVIALAYYAELTCTEIAGALDVPPGTVKSRMRLGLERLRRHPDRLPVV